MAVITAMSQLQDPQDRRWFGNRKPRVYAAPQQRSAPNPYSLEFLIWLQNNFDEAIAMNEAMKTCSHNWVPLMPANGLDTKYACRCGAITTVHEVMS